MIDGESGSEGKTMPSASARPSVARGKRANVIAGIVIALVVAVAAGASAFLLMPVDDASSRRAVVHDGDGNTRELPLAQNSETLVETSLGKNLIVVKDGAVFVSEADCDNHDCIRQGSIDAPGKQIICLPHKLWIEVVAGEDGGSGQMDVDAVTQDDGTGQKDIDVIAR